MRIFPGFKALMLAFTLLFPFSAHAEQEILAEQSQSCTSNEECMMVAQSCRESCASLPINVKFVQSFTDRRQQQCGETVNSLPACNINPPLHAVCINSRCTVDYAFEHNSHEGDYKNGGKQGPGYSQTIHSNHSEDRSDASSYTAAPDGGTVKTLATITMHQPIAAQPQYAQPAVQPAARPVVAPMPQQAVAQQQATTQSQAQPVMQQQTGGAKQMSMTEMVQAMQQGAPQIQPSSGQPQAKPGETPPGMHQVLMQDQEKLEKATRQTATYNN